MYIAKIRPIDHLLIYINYVFDFISVFYNKIYTFIVNHEK